MEDDDVFSPEETASSQSSQRFLFHKNHSNYAAKNHDAPPHHAHNKQSAIPCVIQENDSVLKSAPGSHITQQDRGDYNCSAKNSNLHLNHNSKPTTAQNSGSGSVTNKMCDGKTASKSASQISKVLKPVSFKNNQVG